jgi:hypothetical protein
MFTFLHIVACRPVARQRLANSNRGMVSSAQPAKQQLNSNRETAVSMRSGPRCYKQDIGYQNSLRV